MSEQTKSHPSMYQALVLVLLITLLVVGFFHYSSIRKFQEVTMADMKDIRLQYVQLQMYVSGQSEQDRKIVVLQHDLDELKMMLRERAANKAHQ